MLSTACYFSPAQFLANIRKLIRITAAVCFFPAFLGHNDYRGDSVTAVGIDTNQKFIHESCLNHSLLWWLSIVAFIILSFLLDL